MSTIVSVQQLINKYRDQQHITLIDVRSNEQDYARSHIPEALYLDFHKDLSGVETFLPDIEKLAKKLGKLGVSNDTPIVLYDQGNHRSASKAWFIFQYIGHENVAILDGGIQAWVDAGNEVTATIPKISSIEYNVRLQDELVVDMKEVKEKFNHDDSVLIDSRAYKRYIGEEEPKYKKAGHIPGAKNFHSKLVFDESGLWKEKNELQTHFSSLKNKDEIIVSCGSGNSACMNIVALKEAGFENVKLYPGGFSEWINDENNEVAKGEDE